MMRTDEKKASSPELEAAEKAVGAAVLAHQEAIERHESAKLAEDKAREARVRASTEMVKAKKARDKLLPQAKVRSHPVWSGRTDETAVAIVRRTKAAVFVRLHGDTCLHQYRLDKSSGRYFSYPKSHPSSELILVDQQLGMAKKKGGAA